MTIAPDVQVKIEFITTETAALRTSIADLISSESGGQKVDPTSVIGYDGTFNPQAQHLSPEQIASIQAGEVIPLGFRFNAKNSSPALYFAPRESVTPVEQQALNAYRAGQTVQHWDDMGQSFYDEKGAASVEFESLFTAYEKAVAAIQQNTRAQVAAR